MSTILKLKSVGSRCVLRNMTRNDAINRLNYSELDDKCTFQIWTLVRIKHPLR